MQAHVTTLRRAGMSLARIAEQAGVAQRTLRGLQQRRTVRAGTAAAVLAVDPTPKPYRADLRPGIGAARRVQALVAIGWSLTEQGHRLGMPVQQVNDIALQRRVLLHHVTCTRVGAVFEQLSATPGPSPRARRLAARRGWLPPLAWGDDIDVPEAEPASDDFDNALVDEVVVERALAGQDVPITDAELVAALHAGVARGVSVVALAALLHLNPVAAKRMLAGQLTPLRAKRAAVVAAIVNHPDTSDRQVAAERGVTRAFVAKVRAEIIARSSRIAS
ncbi:hypothetical protein [Actinoplanes sp. URMC 104]|uniref:hypothetical protein n=1 Tax=Actinoplanes sp. URMC 104 TaxID=3423409 RepID=UPI003F19E8BE